jgi:hypothetical protein
MYNNLYVPIFGIILRPQEMSIEISVSIPPEGRQTMTVSEGDPLSLESFLLPLPLEE